MARPLRIEYAGAWYHVMHRGAGRRSIFLCDEDRGRFFSLLGDIRKFWNVEVHAYSLMDNHYHLLIHTPNGNLSRAMRHVDGIYTQRFNYAHRTDGALFRGRFKSIVIERDSYLQEVVRYIHLNPVKAGICRNPSGHRWTSHRAYLSKKERPPWLVADEVLSEYGKRYFEASRRLDEFVKAGVPNDLERKYLAKKLPSVLGSEGFIDWIKYNFVERIRSNKEIPSARVVCRKKVSLRSIIRLVSDHYNVTRQQLLSRRSNRKNEPRSMMIHLMRRVAGASHREIAFELGMTNTHAIAKSLQRFERDIGEDDALRERTEKLAGYLLSNVQT